MKQTRFFSNKLGMPTIDIFNSDMKVINKPNISYSCDTV